MKIYETLTALTKHVKGAFDYNQPKATRLEIWEWDEDEVVCKYTAEECETPSYHQKVMKKHHKRQGALEPLRDDGFKSWNLYFQNDDGGIDHELSPCTVTIHDDWE